MAMINIVLSFINHRIKANSDQIFKIIVSNVGDPPGNVFDIEGNDLVPYKICAMALEPGVYHVHTQLNVASVGPGLGPGQTVIVEGEHILKEIPYTNIAYQSIIIGVGYVITFATRPWQVI